MKTFDRTEEVLRLVSTVGKLPREDQARILRIADLLSMASAPVQVRTQRMLSDLFEGKPASKSDCVASIDEVIAYLERAVFAGDEGIRIRREERMIGNA